MTLMTKSEWIENYEATKKQDLKLLDELLKEASSSSDGTESMKFSQSALNFTQALHNKYALLLPQRPGKLYEDD